MIRSLHLADVAPLLLFLGRSPVNEARTRDRLSSKRGDLLSALPLLKGCLLSGNTEHSLVFFQGGFIQGLVCLRACRGPSAWRVEILLLSQGKEQLCVDLLEKAGSADDKVRAERIFLRLDSNSPAVDMARQAGFMHYLTELLYRLDDLRQVAMPPQSLVLRPRQSADEHSLFRLYSAATPLQVRTAEGMTLQEWSQSRDRDAMRELVLEKGGEVAAWLRLGTDGMAGRFDILMEPGADGQDRLVDYSLEALKGRRPIYCLVPEFQQQLKCILEERGFYQVASYCCFSKQLAVRVTEPRMVPLRA